MRSAVALGLLLTFAGALASVGVASDEEAAKSSQGDFLPDGAVARLGSTQWRNSDPVNFVAFVLGGKGLLTATQDGAIRIWDSETGHEIRRFAASPAEVPNEVRFRAGVGQWRAPGPTVSICDLSPDRSTLVAAELGRFLHFFDVATGKTIRLFKGPNTGIASVRFSPDGMALAVRDCTQTLHLLDVQTGDERWQSKDTAMTFSSDNTPLQTGAVAFAPDGKNLASAEVGRERLDLFIKLTEVATGKETTRIKAPLPSISALGYSPNGKTLAYASANIIRFLDPRTTKELREIRSPASVTALFFSTDNRILAAKGQDQVVRTWDAETGEERHCFGEPAPVFEGSVLVLKSLANAAFEQRDVAFSADRKSVVTGAGHTVRCWDLETGAVRKRTQGHPSTVSAVAVSDAGTIASSRGADGTIRRWRVATGQEFSQFRESPYNVCAAFSPNGDSVAFDSIGATVRIHDTATGKEVRQFRGHPDSSSALAFSPDAMTLAARSTRNSTITVYDVLSERMVHQIAGPPVRFITPKNMDLRLYGPSGLGLVFSPDGRTVAVNWVDAPDDFLGMGNRAIRLPVGTALCLWDVQTGKKAGQVNVPWPEAIGHVSFSPDHRVVAAENADRTTSLWDVASGKKRGLIGSVPKRPEAAATDHIEFVDQVDPVGPGCNIALSPDRRLLAAAGPSDTVIVWDLRADKQLGELKGHTGAVTALAFSADSKTLVSGSRDTTILVWDVTRLR